MKDRHKNCLFICSITDNLLRVVKCLLLNKTKVEFAGLEIEPVAAELDYKKISEKLGQIFKKLDYKLNPVIVSLPRNLATCRYLKVPAAGLEEIENIANLQASRYLPYPAGELITGFQVISTDKGGYSYINLIIAHKDAIERYLKIFKELNTPSISIVLSSYGLCNLYNRIKQDEPGTVLVLEVDERQAEVAIISSKKLLFSRSFKLDRTQSHNWTNLLIDEINKTQDVFLKEMSQERPSRIILTGIEKTFLEVQEALNKQMSLPVEVLSYRDEINLSMPDYSCASLIGLGLSACDESLNLLPKDKKKELKEWAWRKTRLRIASLVSLIILVLGLAVAKDLDNRRKYVGRLKAELQKFAKVARPIEDIEKRLRFLETRNIKKPAALVVLYELYQVMPSSITLNNINYEEDKQILLRGQTQEYNAVFAFVEQLEKSKVFDGFNIKVRYATGKKAQALEFVDFQIDCLKK